MEHIPLSDEEGYYLVSSPPAVVRAVAAVAICATAGLACVFSGIDPTSSLWHAPASLKVSTVAARTGQTMLPTLRNIGNPSTAVTGTSGETLPNERVNFDISRKSLWDGNAAIGFAAAAGSIVGAAFATLYQRLVQREAQEDWSVAAVAEANLDVKLDNEEHIPPYAEKEPFRPDLFQPHGEVGTIIGTDIPYVKKRNWWFPRSFNGTDIVFLLTTFGLHAVAFILGPMTYRPDCLALFLGMYVVTGLFGITLSYHRQLSHRSFTTPKWLEYIFAYCGILALQGDPLEWVSSHRYHHLYCETDRDPHTVNEGLWWSHMGWLLDNKATKARTGDQTNALDIMNDPFYSFINKTYIYHILAFALAMYAWGGLPYVVWGVAVRTVWVWHITWFVNSASHAWGTKKYKTNPPDQSRNNWWVGLLAFGEGWHNNHHAFQYSARHGLEWWQLDMTYYVIRTLQFLGLATNVKLPTEARKQQMLL